MPESRQSDSAYEELKDLILTAALEPGSLLSERDLMSRLGVGRTPLREALQRLTHERLVEVFPRRGYFVAEATYAGMLRSFELRQCIEGFGARLAAERATSLQQENLLAFLEQAKSGIGTADIHWHLDTDRTFHDLVAVASGNAYIRRCVDELFNVSVRELYLSRVPVSQGDIASYRAVIEAICSGNAEVAESEMRGHLDPRLLADALSPLVASGGDNGSGR
jgi:DNA-binding GntR family transcriptional regulator